MNRRGGGSLSALLSACALLLAASGCSSKDEPIGMACPRLVDKGSFTVVRDQVDTAVILSSTETVILVATGKIDFGFLAPVLDADGESATDPNAPAPTLRKHSLIFRAGSIPWLQGGRSTAPGFTPGTEGRLYLNVNDPIPQDNSQFWYVRVYVEAIETQIVDNPPDPDCDRLTTTTETSLGIDPRRADTDGDQLSDSAEVLSYGTNPAAESTSGDVRKDFARVASGIAGGKPDDPNQNCVHYVDMSTECRPILGDDGTDSDKDALTDVAETVKWHTDPNSADTDRDRLTDFQETGAFALPATVGDADADGLADGEEVLNLGSSPWSRDTDGDKLLDADEVVARTLPTNADTDGDGNSDWDELEILHTDPTDPNG